MTSRARILPAAEAARGVPLLEPGVGKARRRRVAREEMAARLNAERILADAQADAEALVAEGRRGAAAAIETATREAREEADAVLASRWLALRHAEQHALGRAGERAIPMAVALAERLLGAALELDPSRIADLARAVLDEARGARRALVEAHPLDAQELRRQLASGGLRDLDPGAVEIRADEALARGELRLHTDVGTIDARLAPRFDRLAAALRDAIE